MTADGRQYKFQGLETYQLALAYLDMLYLMAGSLPDSERFNITSQALRAGTSIALNVAEGSTGQSDTEQARFLSMASRSFLETVACLDVVERRNYLSTHTMREPKDVGHRLFAKLQAFRKAVAPKSPSAIGGPPSRESV
jgi:four helix bundle protein